MVIIDKTVQVTPVVRNPATSFVTTTSKSNKNCSDSDNWSMLMLNTARKLLLSQKTTPTTSKRTEKEKKRVIEKMKQEYGDSKRKELLSILDNPEQWKLFQNSLRTTASSRGSIGGGITNSSVKEHLLFSLMIVGKGEGKSVVGSSSTHHGATLNNEDVPQMMESTEISYTDSDEDDFDAVREYREY